MTAVDGDLLGARGLEHGATDGAGTGWGGHALGTCLATGDEQGAVEREPDRQADGDGGVNFSIGEDHQVLKDSAQVFLDEQISLKPLLVPGATVRDAGYAANWAKI